MKRFSGLLLWTLFCASSVRAQILPEAGSLLNYTQVMFEYAKIAGAEEYRIQVVEANGTADFKHPLIERKDSSTATLICNLKFGKKYLWRYAGIQKGRLSAWKGPYNFEILKNPFETTYRVRVVKNDAAKNAGGLICIDFMRSIVDRNGTPVWFFPGKDEGTGKDAGTNSLRLTKCGTLTRLGNQNAVETDLKDSILWTTPLRIRDPALPDFGAFYNHEFRRMDNGNYMVIGSDYVWKKLPDDCDFSGMLMESTGAKVPDSLLLKNGTLRLQDGYVIQINDGRRTILMNMGSLCEYDKQDHLVWSWNPNDYLNDMDVFPPRRGLRLKMNLQEPHINGFSIDDKNEFVYVSFRNLSRVVKLNKTTRKVVDSWGEKMASGEAKAGNGFFRLQHYPNILKDGNIVVFDNENSEAGIGYSGVKVFSQPSADHPESKIVWSYDCNFDSARMSISLRGGDVDQLANDNFLVCMGDINRIFEISPEKQIVWNALVEKKQDSTWAPQALNRAHYTSSLYPCYFTVQSDKNIISKKNPVFQLRIFNDGTENDSYSVSVSAPSSNIPGVELSSSTVLPGRSESLRIPLNNQSGDSGKIEVTVKSNTNTDLFKKLALQWGQ